MRKALFIATASTLGLISLFLWLAPPPSVPVALFFGDQSPCGSTMCRQSLQAAVLAMEYFNSRSSSRRFVPVPIYEGDIKKSFEMALEKKSVAAIGGIHAPFPSLLSQASNRFKIPLISMASGSHLARGDDLVFRPRPGTGGGSLGSEAKRRGVKRYGAIVSGFDSEYTQEFLRAFERSAGSPPLRTMVFSGDLNKQLGAIERVGRGMDAMVLVLPDWLASIAARELRSRMPGLLLFSSNRAVSPRTSLLAGVEGEGMVTAAVLPRDWSAEKEGFPRFVAKTYGSHIPAITLSAGFDAMALLNEALNRDGPEGLAEALRPLLDDQGDLNRPMSLFTLSQAGWIPLSSPEE